MAPELERLSELLIHGHKPKVVGMLTPGMIHELSNPLNNILLTAGILQEDFSDLPEEERLEMIDALVRESERAQKIARKYMDFAGDSEYESKPHEARDIIEGALLLARNKMKRAKVKVKGNLAADPPRISCDRHQIEQVFLDIILNALDAMPGGGILTVSCSSDAGANSVLVEFADTGLGISEENIQRIFEPFFTAKPARESDGVIRNHGGDIRVTSREGEGATFTIRLPAIKNAADTPGNL